jgi:hypothetical protein
MTEETTETRQRVVYTLQPQFQTLQITFGAEALVLKTATDLNEVRDQLVLEGLRAFLQKATLRVAEENKLVALEQAYNQLIKDGMGAFEKRGPGGHAGPKKAEKIAALAALKGTTVDAIKTALKDKPTDKVNALLNSPKVLAAVEKMKSKAEQLELEL